MAQQPTLPETPIGPDRLPISNSIHLTGRQWLSVGFLTLLLIAFAQPLWKQYEKFEPPADYRMPHDLSNDYWLYERWAEVAAAKYDTLLIGDSVVWGEYVLAPETLSHYLNEQTGTQRFGNLGLDGAHPLALAGLVEHYATALAAKNVIVQCNPLWLTSPRADLQDDSREPFNHPRLIPQFIPQVPHYHDEISPRLGVLVEQRFHFNAWANHLQQAYYDRTDLPGWTLEHPYDNPLGPLTRELPPPDQGLRHLPEPWHKSGIKPQDYPWVNLDRSLQWQAFQRVVEILRRRGNRVFVVVGPFNEHHLTPPSMAKYQTIKRTIAAWLGTNRIPHVVAKALPSDQYGDASHPLAEGYRLLARRLLEDAGFQATVGIK